jgi:two-component system NtrC family sensor kinase
MSADGAEPRSGESKACVVVAVPQRSAPRAGGGAGRSPIELALERVGPELAIERVHEVAECLARAGGADLVVVDADLGERAREILAALAETGPPVIVVTHRAHDDAALDAFDEGAADCVALGPDFADVLPVVALEQIRRVRGARERGEKDRRIRWLEHLNDAIVREIPAALAVLDAEGRIVAVNPEFCRVWRVDPAAVRGRGVSAVLPADLLASGVAEGLRSAAAGATFGPLVARSREPDDCVRAFDVRAERLDADGRLLLVMADVTEREGLAKQVEALRAYNENILLNLSSALLVVDREGVITTANRLAQRILGTGEATLRGRSVWDWFAGVPRSEIPLERTLEEGVAFSGAETRATRADGTRVPIGVSCGPLLDAAGQRTGAVFVFQDLTEIKQLQQQVLQTEKMASIGQLAAGVAHEINNPMGFIHANLFQMADYVEDLRQLWEGVAALTAALAARDDAAVERAAAALAEKQAELDATFLLDDLGKAVRESQEGAERIRHIVQDLRDFSRHDAAEMVLADVNQCLDSTANIVWSMMKHSVVLERHYTDLPQIRCFPMQLKQVFMNLLVNAYQAIAERVGRSGEAGRVTLRTERRGGQLVVSVSDTGVGIAREHLDRIFDPFFTTKQVGAGTGLGLSTSFNIVRRHGGALRVRSEPGRGTTFEVHLPCAPDGAAGVPSS